MQIGFTIFPVQDKFQLLGPIDSQSSIVGFVCLFFHLTIKWKLFCLPHYFCFTVVVTIAANPLPHDIDSDCKAVLLQHNQQQQQQQQTTEKDPHVCPFPSLSLSLSLSLSVRLAFTEIQTPV